MNIQQHTGLEKFLKRIRNYSLFIGSAAIIISGFAQALALLNIGDIFFIRFFSVTQLTSDAIAGFSLPAVILFIFIFINEFFVSSENIKKFEKFFNVAFIIIFLILAFLTLITLCSFESVILKILSIATILLFFIFSITFLKYNIKDNLGKERFIRGVFVLFVFSISLGFFRINTSIPKNFENAGFIYKKLKTDDCEIKYFNDKYIFVEMGKEGDKKIEVLKFNDFFEHPKD